jgi:hypothetical protein
MVFSLEYAGGSIGDVFSFGYFLPLLLETLKAIPKMHLTSNGCVAISFAMLTYDVYAPLTNKIDALPLNVIYYFWDSFCFLKVIKTIYYYACGCKKPAAC